MDTSVDGLIRLNADMRAKAQGMLPLWEECGRMTVSRKVQSLVRASQSLSAMPGDSFTPQDARLLNTAAVNDNKLLAGGIMSWAFPAEQPWYVYRPQPRQEQSEALETWLAYCSEIAHLYLTASNFYSRTHEMIIDRNTFGNGAITAEKGLRGPLNFRVYDAGSYVLHDDIECMVDMLFRERVFSAMQAEQEFGRDALPAMVLNDLNTQRPLNTHIFLHAVYPRPLKDVRPGIGPAGMPIASCWVHLQSKTKVKEGGYDEMPAICSRYLRWSEESPYGASPAMEALAAIRGVNYLEMLMTTLGEVSVTPRILLPQGYAGVPDLRAGGITMGGMTADMSPREWAPAGRFDIGLKLIERIELAIGEIFHRPLFSMFSEVKGDINIPHVRALEFERLSRFSPAFTQLVTEFTNPTLERVFMLLFRGNGTPGHSYFPPPPREALTQDSVGNWMILYPKVVQTSRLAMALQAMKRTAFSNALEFGLPLEQAGKPVLDNLDIDRAYGDLLIGDGAPAAWRRESEAVAAIRQARAEAAQAAQQAEMMQAAMKSQPLVEAGLGAMQQEAA